MSWAGNAGAGEGARRRAHGLCGGGAAGEDAETLRSPPVPNTPAFLYGQLVLAALCNLVTVYAMKQADGFTRLWPSVAVVVSICLVQFLISRVMAGGIQVGLALTAVVVFVMLGSVVMGWLVFGEPLQAQRAAGYALAILGVVIAALA